MNIKAQSTYFIQNYTLEEKIEMLRGLNVTVIRGKKKLESNKDKINNDKKSCSEIHEEENLDQQILAVGRDNIYQNNIAEHFLNQSREGQQQHQKVKKSYDCKFCQKIFQGLNDLRRHITTQHLKFKGYKCSTCNKKFGLKHALQRHTKNVHEGVKDHICGVCAKAFKCSDALRNHISCVHDKVKPHVCDFVFLNGTICGKAFNQKAHLRIHVSSVHENIKNFKCDNCGKMFGQISNLNKHQRHFHLGIRKYVCKYCKKSFKEYHHLKTHIKGIHEGQKIYEGRKPTITERTRKRRNKLVSKSELPKQPGLQN